MLANGSVCIFWCLDSVAGSNIKMQLHPKDQNMISGNASKSSTVQEVSFIPAPCWHCIHVHLLVSGPERPVIAGVELEALIGAGAVPVGLGPQRLRVETAAIALLGGAALHMDTQQADAACKDTR